MTFSAPTVGSQTVLLGTINVTDQFPLAVPMPSKLNGWLNGSPCSVGGGRCFPLNAQVVTILPTDVPTITSAIYSGGQFTITWNVPTVSTWLGTNATAFTNSLNYRVYADTWATTITTDSNLPPNATPGDTCTLTTCTYIDTCTLDTCHSDGNYSYMVSAVQTNGLASDPKAPMTQVSSFP